MDMTISKKKYMIFNLITAQTKDNRPYYRMVLTDTESNSINGIMFDAQKLKFTAEKGNVVEVTGVLQQYNGVAQLKVSDMELVEDADQNDFLPKSAKDAKVMAEELKAVLSQHIKSPYFVSLYEAFLNDEKFFGEFVKHPAAKSVHHAYISGLLEHTLSMLKIGALLADYYGKGVINKELLLMGALFHDVGKVAEINSESAFEYTDAGRLLGHLIIGMDIVKEYIANIEDFPKEAKLLLLHMIASHHGLLEYGSPKRPKIKEALLLHYVDNIDAKMAALDDIFEKEDVQPGNWSTFDRPLERQLFNHGFFPDE